MEWAIDIYLDVVIVVTKEFRSSFRRLSCWLVLYFRCCCWLEVDVYCSLMLLRRNCFLSTQCPDKYIFLATCSDLARDTWAAFKNYFEGLNKKWKVEMVITQILLPRSLFFKWLIFVIVNCKYPQTVIYRDCQVVLIDCDVQRLSSGSYRLWCTETVKWFL